MGSSDPAPAAPVVHHVPLPGSPAAKAAAAAAKAAAGAKTAKAGKPVAPAKVTTPTKAPTKAGSPAKAGSVPTDTALTAALPGRIGEWSKLVSAKMPATLATYDKGLGTTPRNVQTGLFGGTVDEPYLQVVTGDHSASTSKTALQMLVATVPDLRDMGFVVAKPYAAPHAGYSGTAACTTATMNDVLGVFCVWIDTNTFGMLSAPHRAQRDAQQILDMVRGSVEQ
jgi:hypothetical protein